jgi:inosine-uridine nucleoside N-ribohydrolase
MTAIFIDSDNAMGSAHGDVDDGYAVAALVCSGLAIAGLGAVAGNAPEEEAQANNAFLAGVLGYTGPLMGAAEARRFLAGFEGRILALGPLTNVAAATRAAEVVVVGGRLRSIGRWPPWWPHEFNLTFDRDATLSVFNSDLPLTIFPLDVARQLWVRRCDLDDITGRFGEYARRETERWLRYLLWHRRTRRFAIYDLAAALYAIHETGFSFENTTAVIRPNTFLEFGRGTRRVKVCRALERELLWRRFLATCRV